MKRLFSLYRRNPLNLVIHIAIFLLSLLFVPAFSIVGVIVLEWPVTLLINDFFRASWDKETIETMILAASAFWLGVYLMGTQPEYFQRMNIEKDE